ncbi:hypothetical protein PsYK624_053010 [Phanerochaete sordida]|uniref:BTB domain-containing protein n=1 Tax=Phanerochaete sordida TaxID=48140 RepID=A0A9P3G6N4_9APHY|nr:hypothetical protein PsYK624_053010 [Phanerochaete sordida]
MKRKAKAPPISPSQPTAERPDPAFKMQANVEQVTEKSEALYFTDGDVALCAASAARKKTIALRVHKVVLSIHSSVFRDMFSFPFNPAVNETLGGVPVVRMQDDADDLELLVSAFYKPTKMRYDKRNRPDRSELRSLLSLSAKYQVDVLRAQVIEYLESEWPRTLEEWFLLKSQMSDRTRYITLAEGHEPEERSEKSFPEPAADLRLALDFKIASIVPALYYRLSISSVEFEFHDDIGEVHDLSADWNLLQAKDWKRLAVGKERLLRAVDELGIIYQYIPGNWCKEKESCKTVTEEQLRMLADRCRTCMGFEQADLVDLIFGMLSEVDKKRNSIGYYCLSCTYAVESQLRKKLKEAWDGLVETFKLYDINEDIM